MYTLQEETVWNGTQKPLESSLWKSSMKFCGCGWTAYLRILPPGASFPEASLGRVVTRARGQGLGAQLLDRGLQTAEAWLGAGPIRIEAQTYAKGFYAKFGFRQVSQEFLEDGIPHIQMLRE